MGSKINKQISPILDPNRKHFPIGIFLLNMLDSRFKPLLIMDIINIDHKSPKSIGIKREHKFIGVITGAIGARDHNRQRQLIGLK